jgi:CRISPR-associated endonuclease/helicase Cas3
MLKPLYAKSPRRNSTEAPPTIAEHCRLVRDSAAAIWEMIEADLAVSLSCDKGALQEELRSVLLGAALLHDIGKANSAFQALLFSGPSNRLRQPVRHELLSALIMTDPDFYDEWFAHLRSAADLWPVIWAVAGHHLKMGDPAHGAPLFSTANAPKNVTLNLADEQFRALLGDVAKTLGASNAPPHRSNISFETVDDDDESLEERVNRFATTSACMWKRLQREETIKRRTALLKALVISADIAGSALPTDDRKPDEWIPTVLSARITPEILAPVIHEGTDGEEPRLFQKQVAAAEKPATIVVAGTGNGKTTAAFMWAAQWAVGRKLWFTYPTTGTASAGYEDYLFAHKDVASALMHGRALVDLQAMRSTPEDEASDDSLRLESLQAWDRQAVVCTVDTVLGLCQNQRRPLFSFPAIVAGAFVFDEIHSYDSRLFGSLLRFLGTFPGIPVLLMSASIPPARLELLREVLGDRLGPIIRGDKTLEGYQRYRLYPRESVEACLSEISSTLRDEKKVLWVCNTVRSAVELARQARVWFDIEPVIYHSRFRYRDRVKRQKELIRRFKAGGRVLAITTQVCEMSLDISADLMVTAECPLPALVQRLGRLNRYAASDDPWPCLVYPFQGDPYNEEERLIQTKGDFRLEMGAARALLKDMGGLPCSQKQLAERLDRMLGSESPETYSAWLDDGWLTEPAQLRAGDASITVIREEDLDEIEQQLGPESGKPSKWTSRSLVPWTIPMLYRRGFHPIRRAGGYPVAPKGTISYSDAEGGSWQTNTN